ncbi:putative electron transfer protein [Trypanosoma theileri]|uniref:Putative electron transfer protein n=1 Tax=Trypanosoma theileri TaxID=67003 RepID=A0A1X0NSB1_9TRYP|nr:putative electron transfer protein [Trypanosoma theileri]ORC87577.1 putative electron transfer protein [Trypanosoma theileri]
MLARTAHRLRPFRPPPTLSSLLTHSYLSSSFLSSSSSIFSTPFLFQRRKHGGEGSGDRERPLTIHVHFPDNTTRTLTAYDGQSILDVAAEQGLPIEGACGGCCACSTCHVYLDEKANADELFEEPTEAENDMLDQAFFVQPNSRLGCQLILRQDKHDGLHFTLPRATRNMYVDGHTVKPH